MGLFESLRNLRAMSAERNEEIRQKQQVYYNPVSVDENPLHRRSSRQKFRNLYKGYYNSMPPPGGSPHYSHENPLLKHDSSYRVPQFFDRLRNPQQPPVPQQRLDDANPFSVWSNPLESLQYTEQDKLRY
jgi:hypothetical protein